jgi:hypothetical protein
MARLRLQCFAKASPPPAIESGGQGLSVVWPVVGSPVTNQGEDRIGNAIVGALGGAFGSLLLQVTVPTLSGFDDWRAIVSQWAAASVSGALLPVIVGVVGRRRR